MKKIFCLFLSLVMLVSLCACGSSEDVRGEISGGVQSETVGNDQTQTETEPEFSMGKAEGAVYTNDFLGIRFALPEGWEFYSDEQIKEMNNIVGDYVDEDVAEKLKEANIIYDMTAQYLPEGSSVSVNLEKLNAVQLVGLDIRQTLESQIPTIQSAFENMGYTDLKVEYQKVTVDGKEFDGLKISAKIQTAEFVQIAFSFRKGAYLANVSVGTLQTDKFEQILDCFTVQ